ncbi:DUF748 domain-containing protein [Neolewinella aurantiaca]|uniref:DUF748 domain-containing protein n=1 Tax=Neolewinella aurantiaca TaxID=2602767 RepID=A0A5C7FMB2_9BACT|nr:DUF748 domain-containing protein [Neolewinella aurantiaca]TXF91228.1 DUF748 domain-containing protein [Neolewinella aurantiaca]
MASTAKRPFYRKKKFLIPAVLLVLLIVFRLLLPGIVKKEVNKALANIPGYYGHVEDIDIALYRGAYAIDGLYLNVVDGQTQVPFLKLPRTDISVEWKSLFKGKFVSEIYVYNPELIYLLEDQETLTEAEAPEIEDWTKAITDIVPVDINHFEIIDGKLAYVEVNTEPNIDLHLHSLHMTVDNLRNVVAKERTLPSPFRATAVSIGNGNMVLEGNVNVIKEIPDLDLTFSLESIDAPALNDYTEYYAGVDFASGTVNMYSEVAIADGYMKGYFKPMLENGKFHSKEDGLLETVWEGLVGFFKFVLQNQKTDTFATKVPLEGDLNAVTASIWPTVTSIFKNAFISAFKEQPDEDIEYQDAFQEGEEEEMTGKERRQARRAARKKEKEEQKEKEAE